jgi:hypothetical protein
MENVVIYDHSYIFGNIVRPFGIIYGLLVQFLVFRYIFTCWYVCTKKNLATLLVVRFSFKLFSMPHAPCSKRTTATVFVLMAIKYSDKSFRTLFLYNPYVHMPG